MRTNIPAPGESIEATLKLGIYLMREGAYISEHDAKIARKLAGENHLECDRAIQPGVGAEVHRRHPAAGNMGLHPVAAIEQLADGRAGEGRVHRN